MIRTFRCKDTEALFNTGRSRRFGTITSAAMRKLAMLDEADILADMNTPGNRLEALKNDRSGQYSVRVNDQFRLCFQWADGNAYDVEIVDYH